MRRFREAADAGTAPCMIRLHARRRADQSSVSSCSLPPLSALRTRHNRENLIGCRGREGRPLLPARLKKNPLRIGAVARRGGTSAAGICVPVERARAEITRMC